MDMNAKWSIFKRTAATICCCLLPMSATLRAQERQEIQEKRDTVFILQHDTVYLQPITDQLADDDTILTSHPRGSRYDRRVHRYRRHWEALIPTHTKIQFAGNMGLLSFGTGWDYGKRNQWETDLLLGILPKYQSDKTKITFTLKQNYIPWSLQIKESRFSAEPLSCGMYFNTVFGDEFWVHEPDRYPSGYYGFSSKVRIHVFLGQRLTYDIAPKQRFTARAITLFYEISTCDLYIVSAFGNKYLKPKDYLCLSFGVKLQLM